MDEMTDRILEGRDRTFNLSTKNKQLGNVQRSFIQSFWEHLKNRDSIGLAETFSGLTGRLPDTEEARVAALARIRAGVNKNLPEENAKALSGFVTAAYAAMRAKYDFRNAVKPPHVSADGVTPVEVGDYVQWTNNEGDQSVGKIIRPVARTGNSTNPNEYTDAAIVEFKGGSRQLLVTKNMDIIDAGDDSLLTGYTGWIKNEEKLRRRGFDPTIYKRADALKAAADLQAQGFDPVTKEPLPNLGTQGNENAAKVAKKSAGSKPASDLAEGDGVFGVDGEQLGTVIESTLEEVNGEPVVLVKYKDLKTGKTEFVGYGPDQVVGTNGPKA
jgi:hypothetical protein